jgi:hypothetical protein
MSDAGNPACGSPEFEVVTQRMPTSAPVVAAPANNVAFWLLVP